ncbi:hypothetical protein OU994_18640 [Pseudoduganella sp. SL102]|uniref:hypothetical protein n=1 Tax=Pseudoduganella sp. SL102 TaxID=2995154 RepID=UPI00248C9739|nr:hypothetical protein [Pseudoduganella sp. SL102]WBS00329.1 hypothetical protein OU994_18640 [Pseudoduganella sp. SL102]
MERDGFWNKLWRGTAPLVLWAAHFFFCYLYAAGACRPGHASMAPWAVLLGATVLALGAAGWLAWRAWRGSEPPRSLMHMARLGGAILALAAIAWSAMPLLVFGACA